MKKVLVIAGPTAVGKSDFAVNLAREFHCEIISGDSIQVYRGLDIGSGKITREEMRGVKHHLIDILDPDDSYNVADFQKMARELIEQEPLKIICGGTGLYLKSCLYDYEFQKEEDSLPSVDPELEQFSNVQLYEMLKESDPVQAEKIHVNNRRRLLRSLTIQKRSGQVQSRLEQQQEHKMLYDAKIIGCTMDREKLYARINARVEGMFANGLLEEVERLVNGGISFDRQSMQGIGYKEFKPYFEGTCTLEEVKAEIQKHSRQFAKRQYTWLNHQMPVQWCDMTDEEALNATLKDIQAWYTNEAK